MIFRSRSISGTEYVINATNECEIVKKQKANPEIDVFTGIPFEKEENADDKTTAPSVSGVSLDPQINTADASSFAPVASPMMYTGSSLKATPTATGMPDFSQFPAISEEEIYASIDSTYSGEEAEMMKRTVELMLKSMLSLSERQELIGYLDIMLEGQEIEGMGQISGEQALTFLQMMDKETKLKMLNAIMSGEMGDIAPGTTQGETTEPGTNGETTTNPEETTGSTTQPSTTEPVPEPEPEPEPFAKSYDEALSLLGVADLENPQSIYIYPLDFESKDLISEEIKKYNAAATDSGNENYEIKYTDYIGLLLSSVTTIINIISYVLIAFVAISLVVSSIMIGIITYISVLERTKEIGILRAIGASKRDISRVFNAETLIVGFVSGTLGILSTILLIIPINALIEHLTKLPNIAQLPTDGAIALVVISMTLTFISGLIPSRIASKKDPVVALRTE